MSRIPEGVDSKYRYVLLASKRAEQLVEGAAPKKEAGKGKPTHVAMSEITGGMVDWDYGPAVAPEAEIAGEPVGGDAESGDGEAS